MISMTTNEFALCHAERVHRPKCSANELISITPISWEHPAPVKHLAVHSVKRCFVGLGCALASRLLDSRDALTPLANRPTQHDEGSSAGQMSVELDTTRIGVTHWNERNKSSPGVARAGVALVLLMMLAACGTPAPPASDSHISETEGSRSTLPTAYTTPANLPKAALRTEFPVMAVPADNPTTPPKVELGRQLFYDPVLSASNAMSCATCHHPDQGFSNGAPVSTPRPGAPARNVSTIWNAGFSRFLLWDGRMTSLEEQAELPLTLPNEMAETPDKLEQKLRAIPAYVELFDQAFGGGAKAVTFDNVKRALAAFERTLVSDDSPFDRYVAGDANALTPQQQRGLALFFSDRTHCAECHQPPIFASETFRVVGVDSQDPGRAGVSEQGLPGAFKVPTLRNIAQTAPYMHNGSLATLDEVVRFYAGGAGRARGVDKVDPLLKGFELSAEEQADLVAFLHALTDESKLPPAPDQALSGLPVVPRMRN